MASSMGKKASGSKVPAAKIEKVLPKSVDKVDNKITKKKRRFRGKKKSKPDEPAEQLKKTIANFKVSKDSASSNWQTFLASGLPHSDKRNKKKTNEVTKKLRPGQSEIPSKNLSASRKRPTSNVTTEATPQLDDSDDEYVKELIPKSDEDKQELTRCIAIDCEMVGVDDGRESVLARVSLVNQHGECVYDRFVKPKEKVADYRTHVSGVRPGDLKRGEDFEVVQKDVANILKGRILIGHAIRNDLKVLLISHPPKMIRDTSRFRLFRNITQGRIPSLKKLASQILGVNIQSGEHSSVEDAKATMQLYNLYQKEWEGHRQKIKSLRKKNAVVKAKENAQQTLKKKDGTSSKTSLPDEFVAF